MGSRYIRGPLVVDNTTVVTADHTTNNANIVIMKKAVGAASAVTLPISPPNGRIVEVKDGKGDAATNNITVSPAAGTIDGASTFVISENYGKARFVYNGTEWNSLLPPEVSSTEIGFVNGVTAGTAAASKAVVLDGSSNIATINQATVTTVKSSSVDVASAGTLSVGTTTATLVQVGSSAGPVSLVGSSLLENGTTAGAAAVSQRLVKTLTALADNTTGTLFTITVPNAIHGGAIRVTVCGTLGDGDSTDSKIYMIGVSRITGANAKAVASTATTTGATAGATANATVTVAVPAVTGAVGAVNTFAVTGKVARSAGSASNHVIVAEIEVLNGFATGITIS